MGNLDGALISLREVDRRFAGFVEVGQEPELLWSMDRPDEALTMARQQAQTAAPSAVPFWKLFGDLAWSMEADPTRRRRISTSGRRARETPRSPSGSRRCWPRAGATDELARLAAEAFQKFGAASVLLTGMDAAIEAERWDAARTLARIAAPRRAELADEPSYWSAVGRLAAHDGKPTEAVAAFAKGVELAPARRRARR